ncbi:MAG: hypothetical protein ACRD4S_00335 [Candidatus Acidiferrales bacterium]
MIAVVVVLCLCAAGAAIYLHHVRRLGPAATSGPPPDLLGQLPANAPVIAYVDVAALRKLQDSQLLTKLGTGGPGVQNDADYRTFVRGTGFDYTRDLDRAAIAFWPASLDPTAAGVAEDRTLAIADGRFDAAKIKSYARQSGGKATTQGSRTVMEVPGTPPVAFEFLSPTRIAIASGTKPADLLAISTARSRDPAMQAGIDRVAGAPIFAVARTDDLPASFYAALRNSSQLDKLARSIKGLTLAGKPDGDNLEVALDAESDSMKNAFEIATLLSGGRLFASMALADPRNRRQMTAEQAAFLSALASQTKISHDKNWVRLSLALTPEMLGAARSSPSSLPGSYAQH